MFSRRLTRSIAIGATAVAIGGGAYGIVSATADNSAGTATAAMPPSAASRPFTLGGGAANARSGPAAGGAVGRVANVSASSFTITTSAGQTVTIDKTSSTTYRKGTNSASASAVKRGVSVLVLGTTNGTTIAANQVMVQPTSGGSSASSAAAVVPFQRGASSTSKRVGRIPANYSQGSGTIVDGRAANKATEASLSAYPGGSSTVS
jgi:hypothetical protein